MPNYNGVLTEEERTKLDAWYKNKWKMNRCPVCNQGNWSLADHVVMPMTYTGVGLSIGGEGYPQIMVECQNCGYTLYFNAITVGILGGH